MNKERENRLRDIILCSLDWDATVEDRQEATHARWELLANQLTNGELLNSSDAIAAAAEACEMYSQSKLSPWLQWTREALGLSSISIDLAMRVQSSLMYVYSQADENAVALTLKALAIVLQEPERVPAQIPEAESATEYPFSVQVIKALHEDDGDVSEAEEQAVRDYWSGVVESYARDMKSKTPSWKDRVGAGVGHRSACLNMILTIKPQVPRQVLLDICSLPDLDTATLNSIEGALLYAWVDGAEREIWRVIQTLIIFMYLHPALNEQLPKIDPLSMPNKYYLARRARMP